MANLVETVFTAVDQASPTMNRLGTGLDRLQGHLGQFGVNMGPAGDALSSFMGVAGKASLVLAATGAAIGGATAAFKITDDLARTSEDLRNVASSAGISTTSLQALRAQFKDSGLDAGLASDAFKFLSRSIVEQNPALMQLGISLTDASGKLKATDVIFGEVADRFQNMEDGAAKTALSLEIFGRAGNGIIPILNQGSAGIRTFTQAAKDAGVILDEEMIRKLAETDDKLDRLKMKWDGFVLRIKVAVTNAVTPVVDKMSGPGVAETQVRDMRAYAASLVKDQGPFGANLGATATNDKAEQYLNTVRGNAQARTRFLKEFADFYGKEVGEQAKAILGLVEIGPQMSTQTPAMIGPELPETWEGDQYWKRWQAEQDRLKKVADKAKERARAIQDLASAAGVSTGDMGKLVSYDEAGAKLKELRTRLLAFFADSGLDPKQFEGLGPEDFVNRMGRMGKANELRARAVEALVNRTGMSYSAAVALFDESGVMAKAKTLAGKIRQLTGVGQFQEAGEGMNREPSKLAFPMFELDDSALAKLENKLRKVPVMVMKSTADIRKSMVEMSRLMQDIIAGAASGVEAIMGNLMASLTQKTTTFKSAMADVWEGVVQIILAAVAKLITSKLISKLFTMLGALLPGPLGAVFSGIGIVLSGSGNATASTPATESMVSGSGTGTRSAAANGANGAAPMNAKPQQVVNLNVNALDTSTIFGSQTRPLGSMARAARRQVELEGVFG